MHRVAVQRAEGNLLAVLEHRLRHHGPGAEDVPVGQDEPPGGVHDESRGVGGSRGLGVEGAHAGGLDHHDRAAHALDRGLPLRAVVRGEEVVDIEVVDIGVLVSHERRD